MIFVQQIACSIIELLMSHFGYKLYKYYHPIFLSKITLIISDFTANTNKRNLQQIFFIKQCLLIPYIYQFTLNEDLLNFLNIIFFKKFMPKSPICCNPCKNNSVSNPPSSRQTQQFSKLSLKRVLNGELSTHHNRLYSPTYLNQQNTNNKCFLREKSCKQILYRPPTSKQIKPIHKNKITEQILILPFDGHKWQKVKQKQQTRISLATSQRTHPQKMIKTHKKTQYTSDNSSLTEINRINAEMTKAQKQYRQRMRYLKQIKQQYIQGIH